MLQELKHSLQLLVDSELVGRIRTLQLQLYKNTLSDVQFDAEELRRIRILCHPDKHGGKHIAVEMSKKLNSMSK